MACVAGGGTPHQIDILIINNTEYDLELDKSESGAYGCKGIDVRNFHNRRSLCSMRLTSEGSN